MSELLLVEDNEMNRDMLTRRLERVRRQTIWNLYHGSNPR